MSDLGASLCNRVYKAKSLSQPPSHYHSLSHLKNQRSQTRKNWDKSSMERAVQAVRSGASIRRAAVDYGVPKSTLGDRASGRVLDGATSKYLSDKEEQEIQKFILASASIGYPKTRQDILALVQRIIDSRNTNCIIVSGGWWQSFISRHPSLSLRIPSSVSSVRAAATDPVIIDNYFNILSSSIDKNGLSASQIFNMDETGMPLNPNPPKTIHKRGTNAVRITSGDKSQITILACVNASGNCIPPMVIYDRKTLSTEMSNGEIPGTIYGLSDKGWIDRELFNIWFNNHFLRYAPPVRPLMLLMDGHSSHYCPETIRMAAKEKIILFTLPPHTTHLTQPLDKGCFGPLKSYWKQMCHRYVCETGKFVNRFSFSKIFGWLQ